MTKHIISAEIDAFLYYSLFLQTYSLRTRAHRPSRFRCFALLSLGYRVQVSHRNTLSPIIEIYNSPSKTSASVATIGKFKGNYRKDSFPGATRASAALIVKLSRFTKL